MHSFDFNAFFKQVCEAAWLTHARIIDSKSCPRYRCSIYTFKGCIYLEDREIELVIGLDKYFPLSLPKIFLVPFDVLGSIPHVDKDGFVCYAQKEGILLDTGNPIGIMRDALLKARKTLLEGISKNNYLDFLDEFEAYWRQLEHIEQLESFIDLTCEPQEIVAKKNSGGKYVAITPNDEIIYQYNKNYKQLTSCKAVYIPLKPEAKIFPPHFFNLWSLEDLRKIVSQNISEQSVSFLENKRKEKIKREEIVILSQVRPSGGLSVFGLLFKEVKSGYPLFADSSVEQIIPLQLKRQDQAYLLPRGGSQVALKEKKVALIGCGSVGGFISQEIIRSGIQNLTLIDKDSFDPENTFRHVLGRSYIGKNKAEALKTDIEQRMPYVSLVAKKEPVEQLIADKQFSFMSFDLIIVALGNPTIELYLNKLCYVTERSPPIIFTWLEPYGIGGHALLANNNSKRGCLACLYTSEDSAKEKVLFNKASFAEKEQYFAKTLTGCGSLFTPYGSLDAVQTAVLATRLAISVFEQRELDNPILSWKGCDKSFLEARFKLSVRYVQTENELFERRYLYKNAKCPICGAY